MWFADDFGEDLIFNVADGQLFYWDATNGVGTRAINLADKAGANEVPVVARKVLVSEVDRHVLALEQNPIGSANQRPSSNKVV